MVGRRSVDKAAAGEQAVGGGVGGDGDVAATRSAARLVRGCGVAGAVRGIDGWTGAVGKGLGVAVWGAAVA